MNNPMYFIQIAVSLGLLNVWLIRFRRKTPYRGGTANSMIEEFAAYGLPPWSCYVIGALKVGSALALLVGLKFPFLVFPAALLISVLMVGALVMHWKVRDPLIKYLPASVMLVLSLSLCVS